VIASATWSTWMGGVVKTLAMLSNEDENDICEEARDKAENVRNMPDGVGKLVGIRA
jgi:hypothetical protein